MQVHSHDVPDMTKTDSWEHDPEQGMLVELHSLSKAELNGRHGECTEWVQSKERWAVRLLDGAGVQSIAVKPANLRRAPPAQPEAAKLAFDAAGQAINILSNMRGDPHGGYSQSDLERVHENFDEAARHDWASRDDLKPWPFASLGRESLKDLRPSASVDRPTCRCTRAAETSP